ncbi:PIG-L family deacetylase [Methanococcoides sp. SA1]|nr:PIG-L family deacetylase [Methanococcoides sp. SA1]
MSVILVVAAHPDDEVLGCGGTIAKLSANHDIYSLILGEGITSRDVSSFQKDDDLNKLNDDMVVANHLMGVKDVFNEKFPDNKFDSVPLLDIIKIVENYIKMLNPTVIYTHHKGDLNIDHQITFDAVMTACRPVEGLSVKKILSFEVQSSTEWSYSSVDNVFRPNVFENITKTIETKLMAMAAYKSEIGINPHPRSLEKIKALAQMRGSASGMDYAESFMLIKNYRD